MTLLRMIRLAMSSLLFLSNFALAQGVFTIYSQNFDALSSLPAGWTADAGTGKWSVSTSSSSNGYSGASGANNIAVTNNAALATLSLTLDASISTVGHTSITVIWGARRTSTFTETVDFSWSTDGSTWNPATYTEVASTSTWAIINSGAGITLPSGAEGATNVRFKWTITQLSNTGNYRIDDFVVKGTRLLRDGDGTATVFNAFGSGALNNTVIFPRNASGQSTVFSVTGSDAGTLTKISFAVPYQWGWTGSASDVSTVGDGASLTNKNVSGSGTSGSPYIITFDGSITNTAIAKVTVSNLTTPNVTALSDDGNYPFTISTALSSGTLTPIVNLPRAYVIIPLANVRNQSGGIPVLNNEVVASEGVATVASGVYSGTNLQSYFQDATAGVNLYCSRAGATVTEGKDYIVKGTVTQFNGNTELEAASVSDIIDNGVSVMPDYVVVTATTLNADPEAYEGKYVCVQNLSKNTGTWPTSTNAALVVSDGATISLWLDADTDMKSNPEPSWPRDIKGIFYQTSSAPAYVLCPRYYAQDIAPSATLPVELCTFYGDSRGLTTSLKWSTATETNNFGFDIERKTVNGEWAKVGFVEGHGTSSSLHNYSYTDNVDQAGTYSYRIKQIDKDGNFKHSSAMQVEVGSVAKVLTLGDNYPNPFNPSTSIEFSVPKDGHATLKVYNVLGQEVATLFDGNAVAGNLLKATFDASRVASGVYFSRLESNGQALVKRMLLMK